MSQRPQNALAIATVAQSDEIGPVTVISRDVAAFYGFADVWDAHYRQTTELTPADARYDDVVGLARACAGSAGPGRIPCADWLIYLR
jgi:hypothetical protein